MDQAAELGAVRRAYAKHITFAAGVGDERIEDAFATLRREDFLGPGPWKIAGAPRTYRDTPSADPLYLYQDVLIALNAEKELNNGKPSFLAYLISLARLARGERAVHVGAGVGYYTAAMAHLVGESGHVMAIEYEADLAARAAENLADYRQVEVVHGDGASCTIDPADVICVNAGASYPADTWLDALKDGGRLILPLCVGYNGPSGLAGSRGAIFLIERHGSQFSARWMSPTVIYPCIGMRDDQAEASLAEAFKRGGAEKVSRLYRGGELAEDNCWARGEGWALAYS